MNIPNQLTVARFVLTVVFLAVLFSGIPYHHSLSLILFGIASLTDYFDGKIDDVGIWNRALTETDKLNILIGICDGMTVAHKKGILHLDLKPSNVLITRNNKAMVIDYGISKGSTEKRKVFEHTKMYCAPEQLDPDKNLDKRTDIYSLGLLMHQMLCGSSPYSANSNEELENKVKYKKTVASHTKLRVNVEPNHTFTGITLDQYRTCSTYRTYIQQ